MLEIRVRQILGDSSRRSRQERRLEREAAAQALAELRSAQAASIACQAAESACAAARALVLGALSAKNEHKAASGSVAARHQIAQALAAAGAATIELWRSRERQSVALEATIVAKNHEREQGAALNAAHAEVARAYAAWAALDPRVQRAALKAAARAEWAARDPGMIQRAALLDAR